MEGDVLKVCSRGELPPGDARVLLVDEREVAVYNVAGTFHAMDNVCPHRGAPLSDGRLEGRIVTCPWHGWQFDVTTGGLVVNPESRVKTYPVEVRGEEVFLRISGSAAPGAESSATGRISGSAAPGAESSAIGRISGSAAPGAAGSDRDPGAGGGNPP